MENKQQTQNELTKAVTEQKQDGVMISSKEAAEFCEYKKQRKRADIRNAILKSEGVLTDGGEAKKICERAIKYHQAAVRMTPSVLEYSRAWVLTSGIKADCSIGGDGETLTKVKAYEAKCALRLRARELTVVLAPSMVTQCRYGAIRKELKRLRRVAGKAVLKARLEKGYSAERMAQVSKICASVGVDYLSVPMYDGCERVKSGLLGKCRLEVYGVETLAEYQKLINAGVERIVTNRVEEIQAEWLKEVEKIAFASTEKEKKQEPIAEKKEQEENSAEKRTKKNEREKETEYECRLEGNELKFL